MNPSTYTLTTDHPASSYGLPVLVADGEAYGPSDILPSGESAAAWVARWRLEPGRTGEDHDAAASFLRLARLWGQPEQAESKRPMADSRFYLYRLEDGEECVFELRDDEHTETMAVADIPPANPDARYIEREAPADLETAGTEITEADMKELTGWWLPGETAVTEAAVQFLRVRPDDPYNPFCQAMLNLLQARPQDSWEQ